MNINGVDSVTTCKIIGGVGVPHDWSPSSAAYPSGKPHISWIGRQDASPLRWPGVRPTTRVRGTVACSTTHHTGRGHCGLQYDPAHGSGTGLTRGMIHHTGQRYASLGVRTTTWAMSTPYQGYDPPHGSGAGVTKVRPTTPVRAGHTQTLATAVHVLHTRWRGQ